jgi:predicted TIM-barrel fold metal-dependent hydrolase
MEIVDAQLHEPAPWLDWTSTDAGTKRDVQTEALLAGIDAVGVDAVVLFPVEDEAWAEELARREPSRFSWVPLVGGRSAITPDADDLEEQLEQARARPGLVAVRIAALSELERLISGGYEHVLAACEQRQIPVFLPIWGHLRLVPAIAEAHPGLTLIIDHLGLRQPPQEAPDDPPFKALPDLLALARYPNVAVKLRGMPGLSKEAFPYRDVWLRVRELVAAFGAERLLWASDISRYQGRVGWHLRPPVTGDGQHTYAQSLALYRDTELLSQAEKELILGGAARRLLRWPSSYADRPASAPS